jgi:hypothetical protein
MRRHRRILQSRPPGPVTITDRAVEFGWAGLQAKLGCKLHTQSDLTGQLLTFRLIFRDSCKLGIPPATVRSVSEVEQTELVTSKRRRWQPNVTPIMARRWTAHRGLLEPPWALQQFHDVRDYTHSGGRRPGSGPAHDMETRCTQGCGCDRCRGVCTSADDFIGRAGAVAAATESDIPECGTSFT